MRPWLSHSSFTQSERCCADQPRRSRSRRVLRVRAWHPPPPAGLRSRAMDFLPVLLGLAVAFSVVMYVVMDGFDLGVGILMAGAPSEGDHATMINSIAPFWDGNETWLVLGGTLLIAAFPLAYATLLPAFYVPLMTMLFALVFRGIAFEFRFRANRFRPLWDTAFAGGSVVATL